MTNKPEASWDCRFLGSAAGSSSLAVGLALWHAKRMQRARSGPIKVNAATLGGQLGETAVGMDAQRGPASRPHR